MVSDKQLEANRRNAQKSTGPKTEIGKSIASKNAITHGLRSVQPVIEGEDPTEYNDFRNDMVIQFAPVGPMERLLVDRIVHSAWRLCRIGRIEVEVFDFLRHPPEKKPGKGVALLRVEPSKVRACPDSSHGNRHLRFATFAEAMTAWNESEDGILYKQNKWPSDPGCPSPSDSFDSFIRQPKQPEPQGHHVNLPDAVGRARAKTGSKEYIAKLDELAEVQNNAQPSYPPLTLGRAFADDLLSSVNYNFL